MKMDVVAGSGNNEYYTPPYAIRTTQTKSRRLIRHSAAFMYVIMCFQNKLFLKK